MPSAWCCLELLNGSKGKWVWRTWLRESSQTSLLMSLLRNPNSFLEFNILQSLLVFLADMKHAFIWGSLKFARVRKWETFFGSLNSFEVSIFNPLHFIGIQGGCHNIWSTHYRVAHPNDIVNTGEHKIMFSIRYLVEISVRGNLAPWYWKNCDNHILLSVCPMCTYTSNQFRQSYHVFGASARHGCLEPPSYLKMWQELSNVSHRHSLVEVSYSLMHLWNCEALFINYCKGLGFSTSSNPNISYPVWMSSLTFICMRKTWKKTNPHAATNFLMR